MYGLTGTIPMKTSLERVADADDRTERGYALEEHRLRAPESGVGLLVTTCGVLQTGGG